MEIKKKVRIGKIKKKLSFCIRKEGGENIKYIT